jgi:hypothetical protein
MILYEWEIKRDIEAARIRQEASEQAAALADIEAANAPANAERLRIARAKNEGCFQDGM